LHGRAHTIAFVAFCSDQQLPRPIVDGSHCVGSVLEQVQDDLLEKHTITCDQREVAGKFSPPNRAKIVSTSNNRDSGKNRLWNVEYRLTGKQARFVLRRLNHERGLSLIQPKHYRRRRMSSLSIFGPFVTVA
jgi:hypothetical protein